VPLEVVDIRDANRLADAFARHHPQAVCHQAAQMSVSRSVREPRVDAEINLIGLLNVLQCACEQQASRFVFASSGGVMYGDVFEPADEEAPCRPISPYGISKWCGEQYLRFYAREHNLPCIALRYANVYGPRQNPHGEAGVVAIFCRQMLAGVQATIHGDGSCVRDYVYVDDVAAANVAALTHAVPDVFQALNIGTGIGTDVNALADELWRACRAACSLPGDIPPPQHGPPRAGDLRSNIVSTRRAREVLGWAPRTSLSAGLKTTVEWFVERALPVSDQR
jgi:UDP-glucose 4-epimerase